MERKGYAAWYDKNSVYKKDIPIDEVDTLQERYEEKKKKLTMNIGELVVWIVLLVFCRQYLQQHPAEKIALFTWFEVITQKIHMLFAGNTEQLQEKYDLERSFQEVISLAKEWECLSKETMIQFEERYLALQHLDIEMFASQKTAFSNYLRSTYLQVKRTCMEE